MIGMNKIAKVKKEVKVSQWAEMVRQRNENGLTVTDWCKENGINLKTYYYRLKQVRQAVCNEIEQHDIVPVEPIAGTETTAEKKTDSCTSFRQILRLCEKISVKTKTVIKTILPERL
jgi:transposase-like protein